MKFSLKLGFILILLVGIYSLPVPAFLQETPSSGYHDFASLTKALKELNSRFPSLTKLESIGKTGQGRDLWMLQVSGTRGGDPTEKQALLICGNLEGDHVIGSEVALGIARYLTENYGKEDKVTQTLNQRTFYIIPRLNPDGAEMFFGQTKSDFTGNLKPRDDDYDWLVDEDGPEDLNGDGLITVMRVKDKEGEWIIDEKDSRLMKKKEDDTLPGKLYKLYPEGIDSDKDGLYNEDGPGGFNVNRNFPHNFGYKPKGLGVYTTSETETVALIDFLMAYVPEVKGQPHRNVCGVLMFSKYDNLAAGEGISSGTPSFPEPPQKAEAAVSGRRMIFRMGSRRGAAAAPTTPPRDPQPKQTESRDSALFKRVSEKYKEITGIKTAHSEKPFGSMLEWAYFQLGVPAFSANLWSLRQAETPRPSAKAPQKPQAQRAAGADAASARRAMMMRQFAAGAAGTSRTAQPESSDTDKKWLDWIDKENEGKGFLAWAKFDHQQLGEVEIGGFIPYLRTNPPAGQIPALTKSHADFALYLADQFADIKISEPEVTKLSSGLFELKVKVENQGAFPYVTAMGQRTRNIASIMLRLKFQDDKSMELFGGSKRIDISNLAAGEEKEYKWMIISPPGKKVDITLRARNGGGTTQKSVVLQ